MKKFAWTVGLVAIGFLVYNVSNSFLLDFSDINVESLRQRFSEVNFIGPGNDFGGSVFRLDVKNLSTGFIIEHAVGTSAYEKKSCMTQVRGIYYNNQRGLRLWPLDELSLTMLQGTSSSYSGLQMTGGFFRDCTTLTGSADSSTGSIYSIYGYIQYTLTSGSNSITSSLAAGVKLNYPANDMMTGLANNFQYFSNVTPIGYIYDSNGGIGFVGGRLSGHNNLIDFLNTGDNGINDAFTLSGITLASTSGGWEFLSLTGINTAQDTLRRLMIQGTLSFSKAFSPEQRLSLLGNPEKRTVIYGGTEINSSTILNLARKNAQNLCRGKAWNTALTALPTTPNNIKILCIKDSPNLAINLNTDTNYKNKTLILQNSNVILNGTMHLGDDPTEIFIDKGYLAVNTNTVTPYINFNVDGFPTNSSTITQGMYLKGNFIVYGLIIGTDGANPSGFNHKLHLEGKVVSLNSPTAPSDGRKTQVLNLFTPIDYTDRISLEKTFVWSCGFNGSGSDNTPCSTGGITSLVPFVILNGNFPGNLLQ